jgi:hypothetical protein
MLLHLWQQKKNYFASLKIHKAVYWRYNLLMYRSLQRISLDTSSSEKYSENMVQFAWRNSCKYSYIIYNISSLPHLHQYWNFPAYSNGRFSFVLRKAAERLICWYLFIQAQPTHSTSSRCSYRLRANRKSANILLVENLLWDLITSNTFPLLSKVKK